jgi:hypothetical protein
MGLTIWGSNSSSGKRYVSSPECPDQLHAHPASYSMSNKIFSGGKMVGA